MATAAFYIDVSAEYGAYGDMVVWLALDTPDGSPPTWIGYGAQVEVVDESEMTATVDLFEYSEEPEGEPPLVGQAVVTA